MVYACTGVLRLLDPNEATEFLMQRLTAATALEVTSPGWKQTVVKMGAMASRAKRVGVRDSSLEELVACWPRVLSLAHRRRASSDGRRIPSDTVFQEPFFVGDSKACGPARES